MQYGFFTTSIELKPSITTHTSTSQSIVVIYATFVPGARYDVA